MTLEQAVHAVLQAMEEENVESFRSLGFHRHVDRQWLVEVRQISHEEAQAIVEEKIREEEQSRGKD